MSSLNSLYLKLDTLETLVSTLKAKGEKGIELTISINDEVNDYDQNISGYVSQTKEQRDAKAKKFFIGNGKTFWTDGKITVAKKKEVLQATPITEVEDNNNLPF